MPNTSDALDNEKSVMIVLSSGLIKYLPIEESEDNRLFSIDLCSAMVIMPEEVVEQICY